MTKPISIVSNPSILILKANNVKQRPFAAQTSTTLINKDTVEADIRDMIDQTQKNGHNRVEPGLIA